MFLCIVQNYWGRGKTIDEAKKNAKREGGSLKRYIIYEVVGPDEFQDNDRHGVPGKMTHTHVDGMGFIVHHHDATLKEVARYPKSLK